MDWRERGIRNRIHPSLPPHLRSDKIGAGGPVVVRSIVHSLKWRAWIAGGVTLAALAALASWNPVVRIAGSTVLTTRWGALVFLAIPTAWGWVALGAANRRTRIRGLIAAIATFLICLVIVWIAEQQVQIYCLTGDC
jgi:hypothetical protein